ncbi:MAG: hypothetical protein JNM10_17870, partial [Planctomycetia bacterium]|nr:hypothetical protein [Planctomycetia bacterium]
MACSLALHAALFVGLARGAARTDAPAEVVFTVSVASAAADDAPAGEIEREPPPDDPALPELPPLEAVPADAPPPEPDAPPPEPADAEPEERATTFETLGPRSATTPVRRPAADVAPRTAVPPVAVAVPAPPRPVSARPPSVASAGASAVEGARPDASNQPPVYPTEARVHRWTGVVTLRLGVDAAGTLRSVEGAAAS